MCLTSASPTRPFAAGLHCPLTATPFRLMVDVRRIQRAPVITIKSMLSHLRRALPTEVKWFWDPTACLILNLFGMQFILALDRQQQSKQRHKVQCVPHHNKLAETIKPCTTRSTSKGAVSYKSSNYSETWCAVTVWAGESEQASAAKKLIVKTLNRQIAPAVLLMSQWKAKPAITVDMCDMSAKDNISIDAGKFREALKEHLLKWVRHQETYYFYDILTKNLPSHPICFFNFVLFIYV